MSAPAYPAYKESGVEWLGQVPAHWTVGSLKREFDVRLGKMLQPESKAKSDVLRPYLRAANIQWGRPSMEEVKEMWFAPSEAQELELVDGDLLVSEGGDVGRSAIWSGELPGCLIQNSVNRVRAIGEASTRFLLYWMSCIKQSGYIDILCNKSTIAHFTAEKVANVEVAFPPAPEQVAIAAFLDRETGKIDALVEEQRRLIALLKEKRQAVISHAVTKGLNPHAPLKPSGIEWLGDIPAHWEVVQLRQLVDAQRPITYGIVQPGQGDPSGRFMIRGQDYSFGWVSPDQVFRVSHEIEVPYRRARLRQGDLVVTIVGAGTGNTAVVPSCFDGANITQTTARVAVDAKKAEPGFLALALRSATVRLQIEQRQKGAAQPGLNLEHLKAFLISVPPMDEQREIAAKIETELAQLEALSAEANSSMLLLQERRAALISAAVTGKIDVRGIVEAA